MGTPSKTKTLKLEGDIKGQLSIELGKTLESYDNGLFKKVVINLGKVSFIDSCGIGALLYYRGVFEREGVELTLAVSDNGLKKVITDCRLEEVFTIIPANN